MEYLVTSKKTSELNKKNILDICSLKNTHWKNGLKSNLDWFNKYVKSNDVHNLLFINNKLIGYTLLRVRTVYINNVKKNICILIH